MLLSDITSDDAIELDTYECHPLFRLSDDIAFVTLEGNPAQPSAYRSSWPGNIRSDDSMAARQSIVCYTPCSMVISKLANGTNSVHHSYITFCLRRGVVLCMDEKLHATFSNGINQCYSLIRIDLTHIPNKPIKIVYSSMCQVISLLLQG